jgi:hypothetical protein
MDYLVDTNVLIYTLDGTLDPSSLDQATSGYHGKAICRTYYPAPGNERYPLCINHRNLGRIYPIKALPVGKGLNFK